MLAWLGALGWLVAREYRPLPEGERAAGAAVRLPPTTTFYALYAGSQQVGFRSVSTDTLPDGVRVTSRVDVDIPLPLVPRRLLWTTEALYDRRLGLRSFTTTMSGEAGQQTVTGTVGPDSMLLAVVTGRGQTRPDTVVLPVPAEALLSEAVSLHLAAGEGLRVGDTVAVTVLNPAELTVGSRRITVTAESTFVLPDSAVVDSITGEWIPSGLDTVRTVRAEWTEHGLPVRAWIDRRGAVIELETPLGLSERRGPFEIVNAAYVRRRPRNVQAVPLEVSVPGASPEGPSSITLGPVNLRQAGVSLTTPWQQARQAGLDSRPPGALRPDAGGSPADSLLRAGAPPPPAAVAADARRILGAELAPSGEIVRKLGAWVASNIRTGPPNLGGSAETLRARSGDSSDRALLLSDMARSVGIPARPVAGLISTGGRLRYRAWTEVWLGTWVPVDPTLAQFPADGGHFRLLIDAMARPATVVPLLGAVRPSLTTTPTAP